MEQPHNFDIDVYEWAKLPTDDARNAIVTLGQIIVGGRAVDRIVREGDTVTVWTVDYNAEGLPYLDDDGETSHTVITFDVVTKRVAR